MRKNDHQQIIEVMGDAASKPPHNLHFLGLPHFFLELLPGRNVPENALDNFSSVEFCEACVHLNSDRTAIGLMKMQFSGFYISSGQCVIQHSPVRDLIGRLKDFLLMLTNDLGN